MGNLTSFHCIVSGRVQGIGFRWFVENTAKVAGLTGWVKNLSNGNVEIEAEGDRSSMESFLENIRTGHSGAAIKDMTVQWRDITEKEYGSFEISY